MVDLGKNCNGALTNQTLFIVLEGDMVVVAVIVLNLLHPGPCFYERFTNKPKPERRARGRKFWQQSNEGGANGKGTPEPEEV